MDSRQLLKLLTETPGPSGYEERVAQVIKHAFGLVCDEVSVDRLGNVTGQKRGEGQEPRPKVMLAAHMDEVALVVTKIEPNGFLRFAHPGIDKRTLPAAEVVVHGKRDVPGIICVMPPHLLKPEDREKSYKTEDLAISVGLPDEELRQICSVGDLVTPQRPFLELLGSNVAGKALDDRAGVAVLYECLTELSRMKHGADVYAVATVQEEPGLRGARTVTYAIMPDIGIAVDVGFGDQPGVPDEKQLTLDKGPGLAIGPNIHPKIFGALKDIAADLGIPYQIEVTPGRSGTDAWVMQITREGVPTAIVSVPTRNMHTSVEVCNMSDIKRLGRLLAQFVTRVDRAFLEGLVWS